MSEKDDGGPAYPTAGETDAFGLNIEHYRDGMSVRDWFAGQAITGIIAADDPDLDPKTVASAAYAFADAMLEERSK